MMRYILILCIYIFLNGDELRVDQDMIKAKYLLSYNYEKIQNYNEAIKVLTPLYQKYPQGYTLNLRFGWLFYLDKKYTDSIKYYKIATTVQPYALEPKLGLIRTYLTISSFEDAQNVCDHILKIDYYNYYANLYLIQALIAQKNYSVATEVINKMLLIYPTDVSFLEQLSIVYKVENNENLMQLYDDILALDPNNVLVKNDLISK